MELAGAFLTVFGYVLSLPVIFRIRAVFRERRVRWFVGLEVGITMVAAGYVLMGRLLPAAINAVAGLILAYLWWTLGRRSPDDPRFRALADAGGRPRPAPPSGDGEDGTSPDPSAPDRSPGPRP